MKFEYKVVRTWGHDSGRLEASLNQLGIEGWELVNSGGPLNGLL